MMFPELDRQHSGLSKCPSRVICDVLTLQRLLPVFPGKQTCQAAAGMSQRCQKQTKKAATFDAVWRFSEHHTDRYVSGSDMKNVVWDRWPHHDETSKERAYCGSGGFKKLKLTALSDENEFQ
jgi:hypothetical protein